MLLTEPPSPEEWLFLLDARAVVLANGEIHDLAVVKQRLAGWEDALVVAADGGSRYAVALGLKMEAVLGDLDSIDDLTRSVLERSGVPIHEVPRRKDETDLELALVYAIQHGAQRIAVLGAFGGRVDMTIANVHLLLDPAFADSRIELWEGRQTAWLIRPPGEDIGGQVGDTLSLLPLGNQASGIVTHNLEYPLRDETLATGSVRGVSNLLSDTRARVDLKEGSLLAVHTPGRA